MFPHTYSTGCLSSIQLKRLSVSYKTELIKWAAGPAVLLSGIWRLMVLLLGNYSFKVKQLLHVLAQDQVTNSNIIHQLTVIFDTKNNKDM